MTNAVDVAAFITGALKLPLYDTKKLQKLVYFSQAWALAWTGKPLFADDFEAWPDGPVAPAVYRVQKYEAARLHEPSNLSADEADIVTSVVDFYGQLSYTDLVDLTHEHTPWLDARAGRAPDAPSHVKVPRDAIRTFYTRQAIMSADGPVRRGRVSQVSDVDAHRLGRRASSDWAEGLALLADA
ncbi:Panacea domain-containing protein [Frigoribacterium sp. SL97]|uniref:Panacea domain-containing protein n=1 Tax=Frigoribacterium sp. SL97 TaxID=2994664 RepID=UPI002270C29C|nr:Panacea domain-containing protein [Frigoribacterium sp. SL97]WAC50298.1 Panacea domain-containing protein [Frigoribacterium sp. SL97]